MDPGRAWPAARSTALRWCLAPPGPFLCHYPDVHFGAGTVRLATGVAAALLVGSGLACGAEPRAQSADQLVYAVGPENGSTRGGLFVVDDNGENRRRLTSIPPGTVYDGVWSPKG